MKENMEAENCHQQFVDSMVCFIMFTHDFHGFDFLT